jgi:hypothetical protein
MRKVWPRYLAVACMVLAIAMALHKNVEFVIVYTALMGICWQEGR